MGVTLTKGVLRLVRAGGFAHSAEPDADFEAAGSPDLESPRGGSFVIAPEATETGDPASGIETGVYRPGVSDIEAGIAMISAGLATRVVLSGFPSWPGLLWEAYKLAEASGVVILPAVVRPGGRVDIVIERDNAADG